MTEQQIQDNKPTFAADALSFIPLGGSGEFGCNLNVYHCNGKFLIVDCGIGFPDERFPGVDTLLPDPAFLRYVTKDIVGLVITHAHDDHKGAVAALWPQLNCPIYAAPLVCELLRFQLKEWDLERRVTLNEVKLGSTIQLGPFNIEFINTAHSVVETSMLLIKTDKGNVLHTGDWRIDDTPVEGEKTDRARLQKLADENILALVGDSTNAMVTDRHPSESELAAPIAELLSKAPGRVIITTFSHSIPRMRSVANAAKKAGRFVGMTGRSMLKVYGVAQNLGYLQGMPPFISDREVMDLDRKRVVVFATGSQGETGSALERIAFENHSTVKLDAGDMVVFSAREISGNEKPIERIRNALLHRGVRVIQPEDRFVHASGHAYREEVRELLEWVKPLCVIPVHGQEENQLAHVQVAKDTGVKHFFIPQNGDVIALYPTGPVLTAQLQSGLMAVDGLRVVPMRDSLALKDRHRIANEGSIMVTIVADAKGNMVQEPMLAVTGLGTDEDDIYELEEMILNDMDTAYSGLSKDDRRDSEMLKEALRLSIRRTIKRELGKRPLLTLHLVQVK